MPVVVEGVAEVVERLREIAGRAVDQTEALEAWAVEIDALVTATSTAERTPEGTRWARRKPTAAARRGGTVRRGRPRAGAQTGRPVGVLTGAMLRSIDAEVDTPTSVRLAVSTEYAKAFAFGSRKRGQRGRAMLPKRPRGPFGEAYGAFLESMAGFVIEGRGRRGRGRRG